MQPSLGDYMERRGGQGAEFGGNLGHLVFVPAPAMSQVLLR